MFRNSIFRKVINREKLEFGLHSNSELNVTKNHKFVHFNELIQEKEVVNIYGGPTGGTIVITIVIDVPAST